ncbi:MAG: hypothetical protein WD512_01860, partial [Candidatus Paceibacterota bacterium]
NNNGNGNNNGDNISLGNGSDESLQNRSKYNLVPLQYRIKVPQLVWESKRITWHGHAYHAVQRALKEALCDKMVEMAIIHMTELVASGYISELWDSLWETFFMQGLVFSRPSLLSFFLNEYKFLNTIKNKLVKHHNLYNLINNQVFRNHMAELLTIFGISEHRPCPNELLMTGYVEESVNLIMEPIKDGVSRSLSQEYILMSKTDEIKCVQLEELHYNLAKFFEAVRALTARPRALGKTIEESEEESEESLSEDIRYADQNLSDQTFFWIHEIVRMTDIELKPTLQNYLPRQEEEWTRHPSNILWNYLFIRAPNKIWGLLATLMEIFTINFKRKQTLTCSAILQNVLILIHDETFLNNIRPNNANYIRSREPLIIQNVLKINELIKIK